MDGGEWAGVVARYADRVHRVIGDNHHVVSPLGAWIILALCSTLSEGAARDELVKALGAEPDEAAQFSSALVASPHPLVGCGAAMWNEPSVNTKGLSSWKSTLPEQVETGDIPTKASLDKWADRHTLGLIRSFPIDPSPDLVFLMATALATKVSWAEPFMLAPGSALGASSPWSTDLQQALRTPPYNHGHVQFIAEGARSGLLGVHIAKARDGLAVCSAIAEPGVPAADVLADAHAVALAEAQRIGSSQRRSLFELPLGDGPVWTITEEPVQTVSPDRREESCQSVLPAWSIESKHDLGVAELGFPAAAEAVGHALELTSYRYEARQSAIARYSRLGFEAAAISAFGIAVSAPTTRPGLRRSAELRFGHPFAAVAVVVSSGWPAIGVAEQHPWHGLPVFSAWIKEPSEAEEAG